MWFVVYTIVTAILHSILDEIHIPPLWGVYGLTSLFALGIWLGG